MRRSIPQRYERHPAQLFGDAVAGCLRPGLAILDVGSGRRPAIAPADRPAGCSYVGLDVCAAELELAPPGSYGEHVVADIATPSAQLRERFDLIVSWQVLEHVHDNASALANLQSYLRPGGRLVALLSGRFSVSGMLNSALPPRLAVRLMRDLLRRDPDSVFPAYYDRCHARALRELLGAWSAADVVAIFQGGAYFNFFEPLRSAYFVYENWAASSGRDQLATHYLIVSQR